MTEEKKKELSPTTPGYEPGTYASSARTEVPAAPKPQETTAPTVPPPKVWLEWEKNRGSGTQGDELAGTLKNLYSGNGSYAAALAAQQKAQQAAVDKAVSTLNGQKQETNRSYADLFKQLYAQKMNAKKNIGQQMAAQGVTGGASESTLLGLETDYLEALRQGRQGRISALGELDRAITSARLDGDIAKAQLAADGAREQAASYAGVLQTLLNRYDNQQAQQTAYGREDAANKLSYARQLALSIAQGGNMPTDDLLTEAGMTREDAEGIVSSVARSQALKKAENLAQYGDFSGYAALGYTAEEIAAMKATYDKAVAAERAASAPKYTPKTYTATQAEQALKVALQGDTSDAVRTIIEGYYGLPMESVLSANGYVPEPDPSPRLPVDMQEGSGAVYTASGKQVAPVIVDYFNELLEDGTSPENITKIVAGWVDTGYRGMTEEAADALFDTVKYWGR